MPSQSSVHSRFNQTLQYWSEFDSVEELMVWMSVINWDVSLVSELEYYSDSSSSSSSDSDSDSDQNPD